MATVTYYRGDFLTGYTIDTSNTALIEKLEAKKMCECAEELPEGPSEPTVTYKATPREVFVTNYDEDEECISCSA